MHARERGRERDRTRYKEETSEQVIGSRNTSDKKCMDVYKLNCGC